MKKAMYKQPQTDVLTLHTAEYMMLGPVSPGTPTDPGDPPGAHAPKRGDIIP